MQRHAFLHSQVLLQSPFGKEICRQLYRTPKPSPDHGRRRPTVPTLEPFRVVDFPEPIDRALILVLCSDREERRIALQPRLDKEEGRTQSGSYYTRGGTREDVDAERLNIGVMVEEVGGMFTNWLIEPEATAVEAYLVAILELWSEPQHK